MEKTIHQGRNVKRFREMLGIKQEALALELGDDWNQRKISLLEQKEVIESELLDPIAKALKVPVEAIRNFDENTAITVISSTFQDNSSILNNNPVFNPIKEWLEAIEEIKKLYAALLKEKDEKIVLMERLLNQK
jgi:transcriptional regulator with XRE-family HTH domain